MVTLTRDIELNSRRKIPSLRASNVLHVVRHKFMLTGQDICVGESLSRSLMLTKRGYVRTSDRDSKTDQENFKSCRKELVSFFERRIDIELVIVSYFSITAE